MVGQGCPEPKACAMDGIVQFRHASHLHHWRTLGRVAKSANPVVDGPTCPINGQAARHPHATIAGTP
jgi:hypothetical protein